MSTTEPLARSLRTVLHTVAVRHPLTDRPVPGLTARLVPPSPWWWSLRTTGSTVLVHARSEHAADDPDLGEEERQRRRPHVRLAVVDPEVAVTLAVPATTLRVDADVVHDLVPLPQTVTVVLTTSTGAAAAGHAVRLEPSGQPPLAVAAVPGSAGTYATAPRSWSAAETTFDLVVDDRLVRRCALDPFRLDTRLHAVSPA